MSQKAMSLLAIDRVNRRPIVWASKRKTASEPASATGQGAPSAMATSARAIAKMNRPMMPSRGRYWKRTSAYAAVDPSISASTALTSPTTTVLMYGRTVVVAELDQDVVPRVERRLEVHEGDEERPAVDLDRQL